MGYILRITLSFFELNKNSTTLDKATGNHE